MLTSQRYKGLESLNSILVLWFLWDNDTKIWSISQRARTIRIIFKEDCDEVGSPERSAGPLS